MMKELKKMGNILPIISNSDTNDFEQILNNKSEMISLMINYDIEIFDVSSALLVLILDYPRNCVKIKHQSIAY